MRVGSGSVPPLVLAKKVVSFGTITVIKMMIKPTPAKTRKAG